jgi:flagellar hook-associated protein 1 FlgK
MSGLFGAIQISMRSLLNAQAAMSVVNENIANVNTEGYSRRRVVFSSGDYQETSYGLVGSGAEIERIDSVRDLFLQSRIAAEYQSKGFYEGQQFGVGQLETIIAPSDGHGVSDQLSRFFDSFLELAGDPSSISLREVTISEGGELARRVRATVTQLDALDESNKTRIEDSVNTVNGILDRIAAINQKLQPLLKRGNDGGALYDERQLLLDRLSEEMPVQVLADESYNMTVTTTSGRLLLFGNEVTHLTVNRSSDGAFVKFKDEDINSELTGGKLGGLLDFQGSVLVSARDSINVFARELVTQVNTTHGQGLDLEGNAGGDFFSAVAGDEARTIAVAVADYREIAATGPGGGIGDGRNAQALADLRDLHLPGLDGQSMTGYYSQIIFDAGLAARGVNSNLELQEKVLRQLESQREGISGVSLDEEAVNLLQYQRAYQAGAKMIRVLDSLLEETINLVK